MIALKPCSTTTLWGRADLSLVLTKGVVWYNTPSHGGLGVTKDWAQKNLTPQAQHLGTRQYGKLWYEEDCQYAIVFFECPALDVAMNPTLRSTYPTTEIQAQNEKVIRDYYPEYFDPTFQQFCRKHTLDPNSLIVPGTRIYTGRSCWVVQPPCVYTREIAKKGYVVSPEGISCRVYRLTFARAFDDTVSLRNPDNAIIWHRPTERYAQEKECAV